MLSAATTDVRLFEPFNNTSQFTTSNGFGADQEEYFGIADGNGDGGANFGGQTPTGLRAYTGLNDNHLTGHDFDDLFEVLPLRVTWSNVNVAGLTNIAFSADFAEFTGEASTADSGDRIIVEAALDGGAFTTILSFVGNSGVMQQDTNLDGTGDGPQLMTAAQTFGVAIPGTGSLLTLRMSFEMDATGEDFGIDNVCVGEAPDLVAGDDQYLTPQDTQLVTTAETGVLANDYINLRSESFEGEAGTAYTLENAFDDGAFSFFNRYMVPDTANAIRMEFEDGFDGNFAIMGHDLDGTGGEATRTIAIPDINILGASNLEVSVSLGAFNSEPEFNEYEAADGDGIQIFATIDGGMRTLIARFAPPAMGGGGAANTGDLYLDTNGDGVGDVSDENRLTTVLKNFAFAIPGTGAMLDLEIDLTSTDNNEPLVVDNVVVSARLGTAENASTPTAGGTVVLNPDGSFTYTPPMGFNGIDTFTYDFTYLSFTETATVTVLVGQQQAPTGLVLNEVLTTPDGTDNPNEYIEIRGTANAPLPGVFLVILQGDDDAASSRGEIVDVVDLRFSSIGSNGFLVIVDAEDHPYTVADGTTIVDVPGLDLEDASFTAFLTFVEPQTGTAPVVGQDLDAGDDGLDALPTGWATVDGVSVLDGGMNDRGYAPIVFSDNASGLTETGAALIDTGFGGVDVINHVMRVGESAGSTATDWVAIDHDEVSSAPDFTIGQSTNPAFAFGRVITNHLGATNPAEAASTAVIIDNGGAGYASTRFHTIPDAIFTTPEGRGGSDENSNQGIGADVATWTFTGLTAGTYRVSATWASHQNRATNSPYAIFDGDAMGTLLRRTLANQELEPDDFSDAGSAWEDLGVVTITGTTLTVQLSDAANEFVIADAVRIDAFPTAPAPGAMFIDEGDAGYADTGWNTSTVMEGRLNDVRYQRAGDGSQTATWTFSGLTPGNYTVAATWSAHPNRATNAPFTILDGTGGSVLEIMRRDQQVAPDDFFDNGSNWENLAVVTITGNTLVVQLSNDANSFVIADAIRIEPTDEAPLPPGTIIDDSDTGFATTGEWLQSLTEGRDGDVQFTGLGDGSRIATWTFTGLTAGMYRVSATWSTNPNRATNAPYTILDGMTSLGTVTVNQQLAPDDFSTLGSDWEDLMTVQITGDTLVVQLSNLADGFVVADAIRIQPVVV
jgi:hypothetical protein